jgi:hypothetical protein
MQVFDKHGQQRDWTWLRSTFGNVRFLDAGNVDKFALAEVRVTEGPAVIHVTVLGEGGQAHPGQPVANHWPDDNLPDLRNGGVQTLWQDRALFQNTDGGGVTGFGLGGGSYIRNLAEGGPHTIWILSPSLPSDGIAGVGMLGGTNHQGPLRLTFRIVRAGSGNGDNGEPPPSSDLAQRVANLEQRLFALTEYLKHAPG